MADLSQLLKPTLHPTQSTVTGRGVFRIRCMTVGRPLAGVTGCQWSVNASQYDGSTIALSENYRSETIGRSDCRLIVRLSADTIVQWDYRPNSNRHISLKVKDVMNLWSCQHCCIVVTRDRPICAIGRSRMRHRASERSGAQRSMDGVAL